MRGEGRLERWAEKTSWDSASLLQDLGLFTKGCRMEGLSSEAASSNVCLGKVSSCRMKEAQFSY